MLIYTKITMIISDILEECVFKRLTPSKKDKIIQIIYQVHGDMGLPSPNVQQVTAYYKSIQIMLAHRVEIFTCDMCDKIVYFHPRPTQMGVGAYDGGIGLCEMCV